MWRCFDRSSNPIRPSRRTFERFTASGTGLSGMRIRDNYPAQIVHRRDSAMKTEQQQRLYSARIDKEGGMKRRILVSIGLLLSASATLFGQTPQELFNQALVQERAAGNLEQAVQLFQRVARESSDDRALAAQA